MTREFAIDILKQYREKPTLVNEIETVEEAVWLDEALEMAIKVLEQEPCEDMTTAYLMGYYAEKEPCEDAISRQAVLKIIDGWYENNRDTENIEDLIILITYMAPVNPQEPKIGHWISIEERTDWYDATYECSCCGRQIITPYELSKNLYEQYPYCHCGAKMEDEE